MPSLISELLTRLNPKLQRQNSCPNGQVARRRRDGARADYDKTQRRDSEFGINGRSFENQRNGPPKRIAGLKIRLGYLGCRVTASMIAIAIESAPRRSGNSDPRFPFHGTRGSADKPVAF
ncbi:hypothetical protein KDW10_01125 [Burkholderia vietnamiensis]|uniref:hypothetical protein n=1 Tax=Burkholderia vietnamiensis TaxID=60552 RepID=UPI001B9DAC80|nr:hypothetical protein [Burkholderia vietnamiensis]MBR8355964.1 hypothetical protein [Burkholderia vietnamiensis]